MSDMCILRVTKLKTVGNIIGSGEHNWRQRETLNAEPTLTPSNEDFRPVKSAEALKNAVAKRIKLAKNVAQNPVMALEYMITLSPEISKSGSMDVDQYLRDALAWVEALHGPENVVAATIHRDETTPHLVVYAVPLIDEGQTKIRKRSVIVGTNQDGTKRRETREFIEKPPSKLSAAKFVDGPARLSQMQTNFHEAVGNKHGLRRGLLGSRAKHESVKSWYADIQKPKPENVSYERPKEKNLLVESKEKYADKVEEAFKAAYQPIHDDLEARAAGAEIARRNAKAAQKNAMQVQQQNEVLRQKNQVLEEKTYILETLDAAQLQIVNKMAAQNSAVRSLTRRLVAAAERLLLGDSPAEQEIIEQIEGEQRIAQIVRESIQKTTAEVKKYLTHAFLIFDQYQKAQKRAVAHPNSSGYEVPVKILKNSTGVDCVPPELDL